MVFQPMVFHVMEPIKGWEDFIVGLEVSGEGSLGHIGQGFGQCIKKFHWLGFSPDMGFSRVNICVYVNDFLLAFCVYFS